MKIPSVNGKDSHSIRYFLYGRSCEEVLLCIGGPGPSLWARFVEELKNRRYLMVADFLHPNFVSSKPKNPEYLQDVPTLAAHLEAACNNEKIYRVGVAAWSLGVKVAVELCKRLKNRITGSVLVCGTAGRLSELPASDSIRFPERFNFASPMPVAAEWFFQHAELIRRLRSVTATLKSPARIAKRFGLIDSLTDEAAFDALVREFSSLDLNIYRQYAEASAKFDASEALFHLQSPHLAIAGEKDMLVPPRRMRAMAIKIPKCEYFEVKSGTHYLPVEYGELLALKIDDFFDKVRQS
jgi:pimeloyl-ACP methyl ester carboxylesterase